MDDDLILNSQLLKKFSIKILKNLIFKNKKLARNQLFSIKFPKIVIHIIKNYKTKSIQKNKFHVCTCSKCKEM